MEYKGFSSKLVPKRANICLRSVVFTTQIYFNYDKTAIFSCYISAGLAGSVSVLRRVTKSVCLR